MRTAVTTAMLAASAALLVACGQSGGSPPANAAAGNSAAAGPAGAAGATSGPASASSSGGQVIDLSAFPRPRPGQWRVTLDNGDGSPTTDTHCYSGQVPVVKKPPECTQFTLTHTLLGAYVMDMSCSSPQYTLTSHGEMSGDFQSHVTGDTTMTMTMQGQPPRIIRTHTDMQFIGPCAPGQTPEDTGDSNATG